MIYYYIIIILLELEFLLNFDKDTNDLFFVSERTADFHVDPIYDDRSW